MTQKQKEYLLDIQYSIEAIESYLETTPTLKDFLSDQRTRDAIERRLTIISEAASRLHKAGLKLDHADPIINRRNTILHQYDAFQPTSIWKAVKHDIPAVKLEIQSLLSS
ncbi:MAG: HepT-like ribonuclease domain-containing protein [Bacteroidota bacterium]